MTQITINSIQEIDSAAREFIAAIGDRKVFAFYGKMGAGKTTFIKAVCEQLGVTDTVTSPTFAIVNEYEISPSAEAISFGDGRIFHFDFYRIKKPSEIMDIGFDEYVYSGNLCLMEWPQLIEDYLPEETVRVDITEEDDGRRVLTMD